MDGKINMFKKRAKEYGYSDEEIDQFVEIKRPELELDEKQRSVQSKELDVRNREADDELLIDEDELFEKEVEKKELQLRDKETKEALSAADYDDASAITELYAEDWNDILANAGSAQEAVQEMVDIVESELLTDLDIKTRKKLLDIAKKHKFKKKSEAPQEEPGQFSGMFNTAKDLAGSAVNAGLGAANLTLNPMNAFKGFFNR